MIPRIDPKVDFAFKHVFGREENKSLLIHLLHAVLQPPPQQQISTVEILNPFNDKDALDDKLSILDIKARDQSGRQFNVEMQLLCYGAFRQRALYYWARLHQGQLQEGMDYQTLRPTLAICFVDSPLFPEIPITCYSSCASARMACSLPTSLPCISWNCRSSRSRQRNWRRRW